jgi:hypothetical protein
MTFLEPGSLFSVLIEQSHCAIAASCGQAWGHFEVTGAGFVEEHAAAGVLEELLREDDLGVFAVIR